MNCNCTVSTYLTKEKTTMKKAELIDGYGSLEHLDPAIPETLTILKTSTFLDFQFCDSKIPLSFYFTLVNLS